MIAMHYINRVCGHVVVVVVCVYRAKCFALHGGVPLWPDMGATGPQAQCNQSCALLCSFCPRTDIVSKKRKIPFSPPPISLDKDNTQN